MAFLDDSDDSCWIWTGCIGNDGYGRFFIKYREFRAHRVGWELLSGEKIPEGYRLVQECSHPQCVRHWRLDRPQRKLTPEDVLQLRASHDGIKSLCARLGISRSWAWRLRSSATPLR